MPMMLREDCVVNGEVSDLDRFRKHADPTDAETAETMLGLAEAFRAGAAEEGEPFGWESTEASRLDDVCDAFLANRPPADYRRSMIMSIGAYLGELLVRHRLHEGDRVVFRVEGSHAVLARTPDLLELAGSVPVSEDQRDGDWQEIRDQTRRARAARLNQR
ncbi:hypothetical protein RB614_12205 [Phytohabitans sp. ZYX-F-186]|uniref:Uncharacterized protein n=1 Tax=Phytohabitans maris TaxID=3071409 RepID=A0ABU0ZEA3_9ACTN|nr:hypothetical protein [Phytohabitans sp. ZYX-F-186]MDQ7905288.1 hypothetical protein [Phytohabitans sp. ZYX-F-186]